MSAQQQTNSRSEDRVLEALENADLEGIEIREVLDLISECGMDMHDMGTGDLDEFINDNF